MIILGILACRIFEDELIHLLKKKNDFDQIILFNNKESQISFESKLITFHVPYQTCMSYSEFNSILILSLIQFLKKTNLLIKYCSLNL